MQDKYEKTINNLVVGATATNKHVEQIINPNTDTVIREIKVIETNENVPDLRALMLAEERAIGGYKDYC